VPAAAQPAPSAQGEYDCLIEARQRLEIRSQAEGVIESVQVQRGDSVRKGQLIATLASGPERADELHKKNFVSANARDEAEAEFRLASEQLRAAQENRRLAELEVKRAEEVLAQRGIRSPVSGLVVDVVLRPGELTSSNQKDPIARLMEVDPLNVELILPVRDHGKIKTGQIGRVMPEAPVGGAYSARVEVVDKMLDAASGTFGVRLRLPNPGNKIPAGVKCRVKF